MDNEIQTMVDHTLYSVDCCDCGLQLGYTLAKPEVQAPVLLCDFCADSRKQLAFEIALQFAYGIAETTGDLGTALVETRTLLVPQTEFIQKCDHAHAMQLRSYVKNKIDKLGEHFTQQQIKKLLDKRDTL